MWFRNLRLYRFTRDIDFDAEELHDMLSGHAFHACEKQAFFSQGWVPPLGKDAEDLVHSADGCYMLSLCREDKILPTSVINDALQEKIEEIKEQHDREVRRRERLSLKDEITADLLPRAFTRSSHTRAYIDTRSGWLVIDAASVKKAEEFMSALRVATGSLPVVPLKTKTRAPALMTEWLTGSCPKSLELGDECELREPGDDGGVIRCKGIDLLADDIRGHLDSGKFVSKLSLLWNSRVSCALCDDWSIKRLGFDDMVREGSEEIEDSDARFDADFAIMTGEIRQFIGWLSEIADGIDDSEPHKDTEAA